VLLLLDKLGNDQRGFVCLRLAARHQWVVVEISCHPHPLDWTTQRLGRFDPAAASRSARDMVGLSSFLPYVDAR